MIMERERRLLEVQEDFAQTIKVVSQAMREGWPIHQLELSLWKRALQTNRLLLEAFVAGQGTGDLGPTIEHEGRTLRQLEETHERRYVSIFGELKIRRTIYGTRETQKHELVPLDARLHLPDSDFSYVLQDWDQALCVERSHEASRATIERILGIGQSVRSLEQMNVSMAREVKSFRAAVPPPPARKEGPILVVTADGKGVPMRREAGEEAPRRVRLKKGDKANKKRQACVGAVYTIEPFRRTAASVVDEIMHDRAERRRPAPQHKELRADLTRMIDGAEVNGKELIFSWFEEQIEARNPQGRKDLVAIFDGDPALWKMVKCHLPGAVGVLDLFHTMERLWQAAHCFSPEGSREAEAFVTERLERILEGEIGRVIGGMKQMATKHRLKGSRKAQLMKAVKYLQKRRRFMRYDTYLAAGYPIGSGVVEGACRHLVKDRMEQTGMHWRAQGAQAMLDLRAVYLNGDWEAFQKHRIEEERRRLYPYREFVQARWRAAA